MPCPDPDPVFNHSNDTILLERSKVCDRLFEERLSALPEEAKERSQRIEEQYLRFSNWARYFDVMARSDASLDARLRLFPSLRDWFLDLLEMLEENLQEDIEADAKPPKQLLEMTEPGDKYPQGCVTTYTVTLERITESVDRLHRLGNRIRRSSIMRVAADISKLAKRNSDDEELIVQMIFVIVKGLYPKINDSLAEFLAISISIRRQRLLSNKARYLELTTRRVQSSQRQQQQNESASETEVTVSPPEVITIRLARANELRSGPISVLVLKRRVKRALTQALKQARKIASKRAPGAPSVKSADAGTTACSRTATCLTNKRLYPRAPEWSNTSHHCQCEWCFEDIPYTKGKDRWQKTWKTHFIRDFCPYVCISEDCGAQPEYFASRQEWRKHMDDVHSLQWTEDVYRPYVWYCNVGHAEHKWFETSLDLRQHVMGEHQDDCDQEERELIVVRNVIQRPRRSTACPFCEQEVISEDPSQHSRLHTLFTEPPKDADGENINGKVETESDARNTGATRRQHDEVQHQKLTDHIASHLESLALISLRYFDDEVGSVSSNEATSGIAEEDLADGVRGDHYPEPDGSLVFEDPVPNRFQLAREQAEFVDKQGREDRFSEARANEEHS
ncbi:hypothetical protein GGR51DRAFT_524542 [Nemania sp. FL0031]|nr:hypothetical protein GGR51DRAFT_524542 [Nemania sp. FL0031]